MGQRDLLLITLFDIVLDTAARESGIQIEITVYKQRNQVMAYVDDIVIMVRTGENLRNVFGKLEKSAKDKEFLINDSITKVKIRRTIEIQQNRKMRLKVENSK